MLAPVAVVLTLAYFRRRELLKLAPLGMVLVVMVSVLSPGAVQSTMDQFVRPDGLDVPTVSDRASDYDAVRPDLWSHLAFGRGWGSYNHETYRILDSEILHRTLEMGVLGLVAFLLMVLSVILSARKTIAARDPRWAPVALVGAAVAAAFLILSALFDVLSFPHPTYIFLYTAGLVAAVIAPRRKPDGEPAAAGRSGTEGRVGASADHVRRPCRATARHSARSDALSRLADYAGCGRRPASRQAGQQARDERDARGPEPEQHDRDARPPRAAGACRRSPLNEPGPGSRPPDPGSRALCWSASSRRPSAHHGCLDQAGGCARGPAPRP